MKLSNEKGQGLVEYALILVLVAIVVITVLRLMGPRIEQTFEEIPEGLEASAICNVTANNDPASTTQNSAVTIPVLDNDQYADCGPLADQTGNIAEFIEPFREAALLQEEQLHEGTDLTIEAFVEFFEVVIEHLDEIGNEEAAAALSVLRQAFLDGNFEALPALFEALPENLGDALANLPEAVQIAAAEKMLSRLEQSSEELAEGIVPLDIADEAIAAVENQLPDDHPDKAKVLQLLNEARELVLDRNEAIEEILTVQNQVITQLQTLLDSQ